MIAASKYRVLLDEDRLWFTNAHSGGEHGYVEIGEKPFRVHFPDGELAGTVNSLCDALPLILDCWEKQCLRRRRFELTSAKETARGEWSFAECARE